MSQFAAGRPLGIGPLPIVEELLSLCPPGARVLDLGAGTGRNAFFLARHGFPVDALDRSPRAIGRLRSHAEAHALPVRAWAHGLCEGDPDFRGYPVILCTLILHYLAPTRADSLLANARMHAAPGALHVLGVITREGDFSREFSPGERYYPAPDELHETYAGAGWEIHRAHTEDREMLQSHPDGTPMRNLISFLIARKPSP